MATLLVAAASALFGTAVAIGPATAKPRPDLLFGASLLHFSVPNDSTLTHEVSVTLTNSGQSATGDIAFELPEDSPFRLVAEDCPSSLGPHKSCTITIGFSIDGVADTAVATLTVTTKVGTSLLDLSAEVRNDDGPPMPTAMQYPCNPDLGSSIFFPAKCIVGTEGNDHTFGSLLDDQQYGLGGDDELHGSSGNDYLFGGAGNDLLFGGTGQDELNGDDGNDIVDGNEGLDFVNGGWGDDVLYGGDGVDVLLGDAGSDRLIGGDGDDYLTDWDPHSYLTDDLDVFTGGEGYDECRADPDRDLVLDCEHTIWTY